MADMIIYIHGFGSNGCGFKVSIMKEWFGEAQLLSPSLSYIPELAVDTLEQLIKLLSKQQRKVQLIGSSLGGFYALYLAEKYALEAVLINPAINSYRVLEQAIGNAKNYYDESTFLWTENHIQMLKQFDHTEVRQQKNILLLLQQNDEVLDYRFALDKLPFAKTYVDQDGDHGFADIAKYKQQIFEFLGLN